MWRRCVPFLARNLWRLMAATLRWTALLQASGPLSDLRPWSSGTALSVAVVAFLIYVIPDVTHKRKLFAENTLETVCLFTI